MKFWAKGLMKSAPGVKASVEIDPLKVEGSVKGSFKGSVGSISAVVDEIPIRLAVPFMKRRCRPPVVATIGGFRLKLNPFTVNIEGVSFDIGGVLGTEGIKSTLDCQVACRTEMDVKGGASAKLGRLEFHLGDDTECDYEFEEGD